jgi:PTH1 family peptidyl-tRNA hydrolase
MKQGGFFKSDRLADVAEVKWKGKTFICIKPTTFMNLSGKAFKYWMDKEKVEVENTLTIVDDLALPINKIRLRASGSDAGHNGLKDIQETLKSTEYARLRFGVGNDFAKGRQSDYVLGQWTKDQVIELSARISVATEFIKSFCVQGLDLTITHWNGK